MDHNLVLAFNEITVLMAISALGIMALMGMLVHLAIRSFIIGNN
jgi:hypothetical protein